MNMDEERYMSERVDHQIDWYGRRSERNKKLFLSFEIAAIASAALIPIISQWLNLSWASLTIATLGGLSAVIASTVSLLQSRDRWADYRTTAETLKHEKFLYLTGAGPYEEEKSFPRFVEAVEALVSQENTAWKQRVCETKEGKSNG